MLYRSVTGTLGPWQESDIEKALDDENKDKPSVLDFDDPYEWYEAYKNWKNKKKLSTK